MSRLVVLPILFPLVSAAACLLAWRSLWWQRAMALLGATGLLGSAAALVLAADRAGILHMQMGNWPAPFGITFAADRFSAIMVGLAGVMGVVVCLFTCADAGHREARRGFFPVLMVLLAGVCGAFLTGDLFNLYVWFEVLLIASFVLLGMGGGRHHLEGTVKYLVLNLVGSMLFLTGAGLVYGSAGTLNMADLHLAMRDMQAHNAPFVLALAALFAVAFALKAALFPLFFWLPASYHVPPVGVCAIFAALLTKVGVYALVRVFTLIFPDAQPLLWPILVVSAITMVSGVLGAVTQQEIKRVLAWHSISQVGYIAAGVGLLCIPDPGVRALGLAAAIVFLIHHGTVKPALFLVAGLVHRRAGTTRLKQTGGLANTAPLTAALFLLAALSLAGLPPSSGFWAKLGVVRMAVEAQQWWLLAAALGAGVLTLMSMMKIWNEAFWKQAPAHHEASAPAASTPARHHRALAAPVVALVILVTLVGLYPQPLLAYADRAAAQLLDPAGYVEAIGLRPHADAAASMSHRPTTEPDA